MGKSSVLQAIFLASTALSVPALAQDEEIEEFVVTAGRRVQPLSEVAKSIAVLDSQALEVGQYVFVLDALQTLPGIAINQNGSFGGVATVSVRGAATDQTLVLVDGIQVNDPSSVGGAFDFSNLDPQGIERVEVLKGPQAVLYGSDAMGGVVNIITKKGGDGFGGDAFVEYGAFETLYTGGNINGSSDRIGFNLSASYKDTDGISAADEADGNDEPDGYENLSLRGKVFTKISNTAGIEVTATYSDSENDYDGFVFANGSFGLGDTGDSSKSKEFSIAGRSYFDLLGGRLSNTVSVEFSSIDRDNFTDGIFSFGAEGERLNFDYLAIAEISRDWVLTAGAQYEAIKAPSVDPDTISTESLFGLLSYSGIKGLVLSGGARVDDHETFGSTTNGELNGSYIFESTGTRLTAAWGEGFKAPTIFQLTFACCGFASNPFLSPERSNAWEVGFKQPFLDSRVILSATYFNQDTDDLVTFTFSDGYQNISQATAKGIEVSVDASLSDTVSFDANYTHTSTKDRDTGSSLPRRPDDQFYAAFNWQPTEGLNTNVALVHNGGELDSSGETVESWTRIDLRASYALTDALEIYGRIENLFDEQYQQVLGYGTTGISAFAGVRTRF